MTNHQYKQEFAGLPVVTWQEGDVLDDPAHTAYRIMCGWDDELSWTDKFAQFLSLPNVDQVAGIVVGPWMGDDPQLSTQGIVEALVAAHGRLPALRCLFVGDAIVEDTEISWIIQSDMTPLLVAYPALEHFGVRGADQLMFGQIRHEKLRTLVVETGGLPANTLRAILALDLPALEHLEIWLGSSNYGWDGGLADVQPLLDGELFPALTHLGLRNCEIADELADAIASAPVVSRLHALDLSLGNMTDKGGAALADSAAIRQLKALDLHHHYFSEEMVARLSALGPEVDVSDTQKPYIYKGEPDYFIAVSE